ncbi:MAG: enoyl-CoA hydratase/isomerase family protein [SAR202 cluster bacterium]|nr:MAG: enoyl-CoA hydratase/isomerase family protein [SAR202 cluster bacterium]
MQYAISIASTDQDLKALVIRGNGRSFCAGADLLFFDSAFENLSLLNPYIQLLNQCFLDLENLAIPTVAVVQGFALAGGLELAMACDMTIVSNEAKLGDQHANFGLMPGGGSTQRLPRRIGMQRAMELLTTGRWLTGPEAVDWGLALRSTDEANLNAELESILSSLRDKSRESLSWIKSITRQGRDLSVSSGIQLESSAFVQYLATSTHPREGIQLEKVSKPLKRKESRTSSLLTLTLLQRRGIFKSNLVFDRHTLSSSYHPRRSLIANQGYFKNFPNYLM